MKREEVIEIAKSIGITFEAMDNSYCDFVGIPRGTIATIDQVSIEDFEQFAEALIEAHKK